MPPVGSTWLAPVALPPHETPASAPKKDPQWTTVSSACLGSLSQDLNLLNSIIIGRGVGVIDVFSDVH